jgi:hypothetical protein
VKILRKRDIETMAIKLEEAYTAGEREGLKIGRQQGESGIDMMAGELLKAAFADPIRVRYAYEVSKRPVPADPKAIDWRLFLKTCAESASMTEDAARAKLAEMGVTL